MLAAFMRDVAYMRADRDNSVRLQERLTHELTAAQSAGRLNRAIPVAVAAAAITGAYFGSLGIWHVSEMRSRLAADFTRSLHIVFRGLK
jgi:hypothetical protein